MATIVEIAAELYETPPESFLDRRKELVAEARTAKDRDAVKAIGALRRPTVAAWLVNLLNRDAVGREGLAELVELGVQLRRAQASLAADELRDLGRRRRSRVADLVSRAVELAEAAGHRVGPTIEREVDETLVAAAADEAAAAAVLSGTLTRALSYSGFGEVDLSAAVALLAAAPSRAPASEVPGRAPAADVKRQAKAERQAEIEHEAESERQRLAQAEREAERQAERERQAEAERERQAVLRRDAEAAVAKAASELDQARESLKHAQRALDALPPPP